ncbi:MAG: CPBP family intramembrane metalloprotease [Candidatus Eremiobacteraeota bacterium]|nr:CPBP family intramembrane metalloprotease [Candidatus Eremiobacteraeota bacterium]MCW5866821.1 CPBP family intramembrane metalloprotease [Candidatus Eremiobacteraeota bacterium]
MRQFWALLKLAWRRELNTWVQQTGRGLKRQGTAPKRGLGCLGGGLFVWVHFCIWFIFLRAAQGFAQYAPGELVFLLALLQLAGLLLESASQNLAQLDWDVEWLVTLPISRRALLFLRVLQRALTGQSVRTMLWPAALALAWQQGWGWGALPLGLLAAFPISLMQASLGLGLEFWLRLRWNPVQIRNLHALIGLAGSCCWLLAMLPGLGQSNPNMLVFNWANWAHLSRWQWTPFALWNLTLEGEGTAWLGLWLQALLVLGLTLSGVAYLTRDGVVGNGSREAGRIEPVGAAGGRRWGPIIWRELLLLRRDRSFMVQTLVMPLLMAGLQWLVHPGALTQVLSSPENLCATAFGVSAYALLSSIYQAVLSEGQAFWILFTLPRPLSRILLEKARFWGLVAGGYALLILLGGAIYKGMWNDPMLWLLAVIVLVGVVIHSVVALCLGVFASASFMANQSSKMLRIEYVYLFMSLCGFYTYSLYAADLWSRCVLMLLSALFALALWQKMVEGLPYLLDPVDQPVASISLADGLIAVQAFFVIQGIMLGFLLAFQVEAALAVSLAYFGAGLVTALGMRFTMWRRKISPPRWWGAGWGRALLMGAGAGLVGVIYVKLLRAASCLPEDSRYPETMFFLMVLGAPIFEEFLFRGLVFTSLRRLWPERRAVLGSALIFAMVHPALSVPPVFLLGVVTAECYRRTGRLGPSVLAHAVYNSLILFAS